MRALDHPDSVGELGVIIREWIPMDPRTEFRAFVHGRQVTVVKVLNFPSFTQAVSQYCYKQYWPEVSTNKFKIAATIKDFLQTTVCAQVPQENFVVDIVVPLSPDGTPLNDTIRVIELNPLYGYSSYVFSNTAFLIQALAFLIGEISKITVY